MSIDTTNGLPTTSDDELDVDIHITELPLSPEDNVFASVTSITFAGCSA